MNEHLLQYIWQHLYFNKEELQTLQNEPVQIIYQGSRNSNQGPDFLEAKITIGTVTWAGNVELHIKTSDWIKHGHTGDAHYNNVVLHVVYENDTTINNNVPVLELKNRISNNLLGYYKQLMEQNSFVPCSKQLQHVNELVWQSWKERMLADRLQQKSDRIQQLLQQTNRHWEETFWLLLARNFGGPLNADAFELIAQSLPVTLLAKRKNQIHQLEALLLGQAGLLNGAFTEDYAIMLQKEYRFLQAKHKLQSVIRPLQFLRMRPSNFPTVRLAQLAMLIHQSSHLFSKVTEAKTVEQLRAMFDVTANDYWHYHYVLNEAASFRKKHVGEVMVTNLLINTIIPLLFVYAQEQHNNPLKEKAVQWLQQLPKEKNSITTKWEAVHVQHQSAFDSQALLYLKKTYCDSRHCLQCAIGNSLLKKQVTS
ncbi:uncharacterized protein DUF2851 [Lacibacter cauensis]|uniref:Uncharacterized protein DUF2851 n=1 Tax=Lacibacter cauensis TaxID=510947 RepID=A0A562SVN0_9BACT|nr:DUF2851 family protein [Lacibacter cauensis]TWI85108.1 uncharacterized protein DUF2851 [Lacibacter cauensis]